MPDAQHSTGTRPIALFGYLGARNIGDDLMLMGLLGAIGEESGRITILAKEPRDVQLPPGVAPQIVRATAKAFLKLLFRRAIFIRVGGTSFHDEYAQRSMVRNYLKLALMFIAPGLVGSSSAAVGIGAATPTRRSTRFLRGLALFGTRLTITRDRASSDRLRAVGTRRRVITGVDLATLLQSASNAGGDLTVLGISALDLGPYFGERADQRAFWSALARDAITAAGQVTEVRLFPFKDGMPESDVGICADLAADLQAEGVKVRICGRENGLGNVLAEIQGCGHFLATRYHAGLLAVAANACVCLVRYNDKIDSIATDFAIPAESIIQPYKTRDTLPRFAPPQPTPGFVERREALSAAIKEILTW